MKQLLIIISILIASFYIRAEEIQHTEKILTDEQAQELGMTPAEEMRIKSRSFFPFHYSYTDLAEVVVVINKGTRTLSNPEGQTLKVFKGGVFLHEFDTSTGTEKLKTTSSGRKYYAVTPTGIFRPKKAFDRYESKTFFGANMDYAVFFRGGIAIHSTSQSAYAKLGQRASGGCARLKREDALTVNEIIRSTGEGHNRLTSVGFEGLTRTQYLDRIKLPEVERYSGQETSGAPIWTYDAVIIVVSE